MVMIEVLCTNGHRVKVNCTPNSSLRQILEEACNRKNLLPVDDYGLKYNGKLLDLSQPVRFTGLINNSKVELVKAEKAHVSQVIVAVQLEGGDRLQVTVDPTATLSDVLESASRSFPAQADHFSAGSHPNLTPVAVHFREEIVGAFCLAHTSLKSLGLTHGRTVLRFFWRKDAAAAAAAAEETLRERLAAASQAAASTSSTATAASASAPASTTSPAPGGSVATAAGASAPPARPTPRQEEEEGFSWFWDPPTSQPVQRPEVVSQFNPNPFCRPQGPTEAQLMNFKFPEETAGQNLYHNELSSKKISDYKCDRRPIWFAPTPQSKSTSAIESDALPESFFEVTEDDVKKMMSDLKKRVIEEMETPLMTESMRLAAREAKYAKYNHAVIRFVFHDGVILQALFNPHETVHHLYKFIHNELSHSKFILYTTPPKKNLKDCADTLIEANLVPLTRVYVGGDVEASGAVVRPNVRMSSEIDAKEVVMDCLKAIDAESHHRSVPRVPSAVRREGTSGVSASQDVKQKQVPKWFKTSR